MSHFRLYAITNAIHAHVSVFSATHEALTRAQNGRLTFAISEWEAFQRCLQSNATDTIEIIRDNDR